LSLGPLLVAGALLSVERACYVWIARAPGSFRAFVARAGLGDPVGVVEKLFYAFKALQLSVFAAWCYVHGASMMPTAPASLITAAAVVIVAGQGLVMSAFYQLGRVAVFFGDRLGHDVPWCWAFPFSALPHPQYFGTVLTIWAFFAAMRFPFPDWYVLPVVETVYYGIGALLEEPAPDGERSGSSPARCGPTRHRDERA